MALESRIGPIEETLKNELESIVRGAQENLTRTYLSSVHQSGPSTTTLPGSTASEQMTLQPPLDYLNWGIAPSHPSVDALSQYVIPAESSSEPWLDVSLTRSNVEDPFTTADSGYFSLPGGELDSFLNDAWAESGTFGPSFANIRSEAVADEPVECTPDVSSTSEPPCEPYVGKGKGKARCENRGADYDGIPRLY